MGFADGEKEEQRKGEWKEEEVMKKRERKKPFSERRESGQKNKEDKEKYRTGRKEKKKKRKEIKIIKEDKGRRMNRRNIVEKIRWVEEKNKIVICLDVKYKRLC